MGGEVKQLRFSEGVSTTSPTPSTTQIGNLVTYSSTTAFLTAKGASVSPGDIFFNSAETSINLYDSGSKWRNVFLPKQPRTITSAYTATIDDVHLQGSAIAGEFTVNLLDPTTVINRCIFLMNVGAYRSIEFKASGGQFLWEKGATNSIYLSGRQYADIFSDGTYYVVKSYNPLVGYVQDRKAPSTDGGTSLNTNPQTRAINSISGDATNFLSLPGTNRMLIERGRVDYDAVAPAFISGRHQLLWVNATDSSVQNAGTSANNDSGNAVQTNATIRGTIDSSNSKLYELWHYTAVARATDGLGIDVGAAGGNPAAFGVFADIKLTKRL